MNILAWPAFKNKELNPYNWLLYSNLRKLEGIEIEEFSISKVLLKKYDLIHMHWPEYFLNRKSNLEVTLKLIAFLTLISILKFKGTKIIWTAHNSGAHEKEHIFLERKFWAYFLNNLDAYITLTRSGREELIRKYPPIKNIKQFTIPHGDYRKEYENSMSQAKTRKLLGIKKNEYIILNFGKIREYKGIIPLINEFKKSKIRNKKLYIVGNCENFNLEKDIVNNLNRDIKFINKFIPKNEIQLYFKSADLIILPYIEILNSGTLFLALSFNKPVLVPETNTFKDIQKQVGKKWIKTYKGDLNSRILQESLNWALERKKDKLSLQKFNWNNIAKETKKAYLEAISNDK